MPRAPKDPDDVLNESRRISVDFDLDDEPCRRCRVPERLSSGDRSELLERRHGLAPRTSGRPDSNSELPNVGQRQILDAAGATSKPTELRVVDNHGHSVRRRAYVALEKIRSRGDGGTKRAQRVFGESPGRSAMSDDQRTTGVAAQRRHG